MMGWRRTVLLVAAGIAFFGASLWLLLEGEPFGAPGGVPTARFSWSASVTDPWQSEEVRLPHVWPDRQQLPGSSGRYRIALEPPPDGGPLALSVDHYAPGMQASRHGAPLSEQVLTGRWNEVFLVRLENVLPGDSVELRIPERFGIRGGIGHVRVGPAAEIERQARRKSLLRTLLNTVQVGVILTVGILAFAAQWVRRDPLLAAIACTAVALCIRLGQFSVSGFWEGDGPGLALHMLSGVSLVVGVTIVFVLAMKQRSRDLVLLAAVTLPLAAVVLFAGYGSLEARRGLCGAISLTFCVLSVVRCGPEVIRKRLWLVGIMIIGLTRRISIVLWMTFESAGRFDVHELADPVSIAPLAGLLLWLMRDSRLREALRDQEQMNRTLETALQAYKEQLSAAAERERALAVRQVAESQRTYWMQEIHDGIGSQLIQARLLADKVAGQPQIAHVKSSIDDAIEQLRMLVDSLDPAANTIPGLLGAFRYRVIPRVEAAGMRFLWDVDPELGSIEIPPDRLLNLQRIVQEALANVLKHAAASTVRISIRQEGGSAVILVEDDGVGFSAEPAPSARGLESMRRRAADIGATVEWIRLDPGTRVRLVLPLDRGTSESG